MPEEKIATGGQWRRDFADPRLRAGLIATVALALCLGWVTRPGGEHRTEQPSQPSKTSATATP
ncbi:hypothetical protein G5C51_12190 [Streptomyces sp. A7024]|uniref:Uncharacterized protein n=1 Tax=Streptomyces coryli TaxID=1128680 RepID=A0A6G4U044_9ACTN|nr:hypothetical protein [Streptomyces coryli]NGN64657.1 hypothetical protein [Streptomyces coryli]